MVGNWEKSKKKNQSPLEITILQRVLFSRHLVKKSDAGAVVMGTDPASPHSYASHFSI